MALSAALGVLPACSQQQEQQESKNATALAALQSGLSHVESQLKQLQDRASSGDWVLWESWANVHNSFNAAWPSAQSAYSTKKDCLAAAADHRFLTGKTTIISSDPYIIQNNQFQYTYRCLPKGVKPLLNSK